MDENYNLKDNPPPAGWVPPIPGAPPPEEAGEEGQGPGEQGNGEPGDAPEGATPDEVFWRAEWGEDFEVNREMCFQYLQQNWEGTPEGFQELLEKNEGNRDAVKMILKQAKGAKAAGESPVTLDPGGEKKAIELMKSEKYLKGDKKVRAEVERLFKLSTGGR
ncbi:MAG: hypothetical protein HY695_11280 [Deltaproteobacteria bacterium]|nr:hypothetical protein [Deltaproteobacteria bacterium]